MNGTFITCTVKFRALTCLGVAESAGATPKSAGAINIMQKCSAAAVPHVHSLFMILVNLLAWTVFARYKYMMCSVKSVLDLYREAG